MKIHKLALVLIAAIGSIFAASTAEAQVEVALAFDPPEVQVGERVRFFTSLANLGPERVNARIKLSISSGPLTVPPIRGNLPLAAGQELSAEVPFAALFAGDLEIAVTVTAGEFTASDSATLTVRGGGPAADPSDLIDLADKVLEELGATTPLAVQPLRWSVIKRHYR